MIKITAYRIYFNGSSLPVEEVWELENDLQMELLRASLKAKYRAKYIDFVYSETLTL